MKVQDFAAAMLDHEEAIQNAEGQGRQGEEVEGRGDFAMVVQKGEPALCLAFITAAFQLL